MATTYPIEIVKPKRLELPNFLELWENKELIYLLTKKEIKVRFQQTAIGVGWIVVQPLLQMLIYFLIFNVFAKVKTGEVPYPLFFLSGFIVWQYFLQIVNGSAFSLVSNVSILIKSYFPRLALPLSSMLSSTVDFVVNLCLLFIVVIIFRFPFTFRLFLVLPLFLALSLFASGVGMLFGALMVEFRDTKNLINFILMIWMYLTPIMYPLSVVPERYSALFFLNPLTSFVESFHWAVLNQGSLPSVDKLLISIVIAVVIWLVGAIAFRSMENRIADVM